MESLSHQASDGIAFGLHQPGAKECAFWILLDAILQSLERAFVFGIADLLVGMIADTLLGAAGEHKCAQQQSACFDLQGGFHRIS